FVIYSIFLIFLIFLFFFFFFFFSSRRRHTRSLRDWSSDVCSSDLTIGLPHTMCFPLNRHMVCGKPIVEDTLAARPQRSPSRRGRSEERRVGKECRSRWSL